MQHSRRDGGTVSRASILLSSSSSGRTSLQFWRRLIMTNDKFMGETESGDEPSPNELKDAELKEAMGDSF